MAKQILIMKSTVMIEVDEQVGLYDDFKTASKSGCVKILKVDAELSTESGIVCDDEAVLEQIKQAVIYGLEERT